MEKFLFLPFVDCEAEAVGKIDFLEREVFLGAKRRKKNSYF